MAKVEGWGDTPTLTIVDDESTMRDVLMLAARALSYPSQAAASGEEALQLLEVQPTPIVITDLRMPGMGGVQLVRAIRARWPRCAIIVITAGDDSAAAIECLNAGAHRYFLKPINFDEFRHALETTLHTWTLEEERTRYQEHLEKTVRRQTRRVQQTFLSGIDSLVRSLEARHPYTKGHSLRVRHYALALARALGLDARQRRQLSLAAKLHDIGKVGVPDHILDKEHCLATEEHAVIRKHPIIGQKILQPIIRDRAILLAIRGHHERIDGAGYPDGLAGEQIPLLARMIAVADCFDALTSDRSYRQALPLNEALTILQSATEGQLEPRLVQEFVSLGPTLCQQTAAGAPV